MTVLIEGRLRVLRLIAIAFLTVSMASCSPQKKTPTAIESEDSAKEEATSKADSPESAGLPVLGEVGSFVLIDQIGRPTGNRELYGNVCVAHFFFSTCTATCPRQMAVMKDLSTWLEQQTFWKHSRLVNITVDPKTDTPEVLLNYATQWSSKNDPHWIFLTGEREDIRKLGEKQFHLPLPENPSESDPIAHSTKLALIDPVGRIRGYYDALEATDVAKLKKDALLLWEEQVPFVHEVIETPWLNLRAQAQLENAAKIKVDHDFQFANRQHESGIRFLHEIVDDAGRDYKGVHYDHGNGVTIGDVDGDGRFDIYFTNQLGRNELWRNLGDGRFEDITEEAGVAVDDRVCVSASLIDIDNDSDCDLYVTSVREGNKLFLNDGKGHFKDVTEQSGLGYSGHSSGALFFDYDRDGKLDLFLCNVGIYTTEKQGRGGYYVGFKDAFSGHLKPERTEISRLYHNIDGLRFEDVTEAMGLNEGSWTGDAAMIDVNRDGWMDLYVLDMQGNDEYYENQQGKGFKRRSREIFPKTPWGAMGVGVCDFDNDEDLDIFVTDMHSDMSKDILADVRSEASLHSFYSEEKLKATMQLPESLLKSEGASLFGNGFFRNDGANTFTEVSDEIGAENYWPWGLSLGDLNADGFEDVFIASSMNYPYRYGINSVLLNENGQQFTEAEFILGIEPRLHGQTAQPWLVVNCDDEADELMKNVCAGRSGDVVVWGSLGSRASVIFDLDEDGDLDIVTSEFNDVPMVLISNLSEKRTPNFLKIKLVGTKSNRQGIGATVTVTAGSRKLHRIYDGRVGYLSQGAPEIYVGLGASKSIDKINVVWPSGKQQTVAGPIGANQKITITESE